MGMISAEEDEGRTRLNGGLAAGESLERAVSIQQAGMVNLTVTGHHCPFFLGKLHLGCFVAAVEKSA